jgi:hypothetical protein
MNRKKDKPYPILIIYYPNICLEDLGNQENHHITENLSWDLTNELRTTWCYGVTTLCIVCYAVK